MTPCQPCNADCSPKAGLSYKKEFKAVLTTAAGDLLLLVTKLSEMNASIVAYVTSFDTSVLVSPRLSQWLAAFNEP